MKAYVTTYGLYNSGSLYGAWISLPFDESGRAAIEHVLEEDRKAGGAGELFAADVDGPAWLKGEGLEELSGQAEWYESLDEDEQDAADCLLTELSQEDAERIIRDGDYMLYVYDSMRYRSFEEQFGEERCDDLPQWARPYFDFEDYGEAELSGYSHYQCGNLHVVAW